MIDLIVDSVVLSELGYVGLNVLDGLHWVS